MASVVVPEVERATIATAHEDVVSVERHAVDDGVVPLQVLQELPLGQLPLLDLVTAARRKRELPRVRHHRADALLVVGQRRQRLAGREIPQLSQATPTNTSAIAQRSGEPRRYSVIGSTYTNGVVHGARDDLGVDWVGQHGANGRLVPTQHVHRLLCADVPHLMHNAQRTR